MKKILFLILILSCVTCYGKVIRLRCVDTISKDYISNVNVFLNDSLSGVSNNYGYIAINSNKSNLLLKFEHELYESKTFKTKNISDEVQIIYLKQKIQELTKFTKKANRNFIKSSGEIRVPISYIKKIPYVFGELDALKALQTFPGVSSAYEANSGVYVRGGNIDQTAIYVDDAPVYNIGHFYGFFSPFDGEALKGFTFYNSGIYSGFGGKGSSVLDVRLKEGNMTEHHGVFSIGLLSSKLLLEGPLLKNKLSYLASVRYSYPGVFLGRGFKNNFVDANIKLKYVLNKKNTVFFSGFFSKDIFSIPGLNDYTIGDANIDNYQWGNKTATLRWSHIDKNGTSIQSIASVSRFNSRAYYNDPTEADFGNELNNYSWKSEIDNMKGLLKDSKIGIAANYYYSSPAVLYFHPDDSVAYKQHLLPKNNALETWGFMERQFNNIKRNMVLTSNIRLGYYTNLDDHYHDIIFEPRFQLIKTVKSYRLYAAFDKNSQYQSYVGNRQIVIPSDFWIQASKDFNGQKIYAYTIGSSREIKKYRISLDFYYKDYKNALDVRDGGTLYRNPNVLNDILVVKSKAYGSELLVEKHIGKIQGHLSYTMSRSIRRSTEINENAWFASNFDRTHMLNMAFNFKPNKKWAWGFLGVFQSGTPFTVNYAYTYLYSKRNEYRLPYYYRIDFTVSKYFKLFKKYETEWNISVFNTIFATNRTAQYPAFNTIGSLPTLPSFTFKINY